LSRPSHAAAIYDEAGLSRYRALVGSFFYPFGIRSVVADRVPIRSGDRILDAGCGHGILSRAVRAKIERGGIEGTEHHAFDLSEDMLRGFEKSGPPGVELRRADVRDLPYDDESFDLIVTSAMLEYLPDLGEGLSSLGRCLKPGGRIFVFISRKSPLNTLLFRPFGDPRCYSREEVERGLIDAGLRGILRHRFPLRCTWLNAWGFIFEATKP